MPRRRSSRDDPTDLIIRGIGLLVGLGVLLRLASPQLFFRILSLLIVVGGLTLLGVAAYYVIIYQRKKANREMDAFRGGAPVTASSLGSKFAEAFKERPTPSASHPVRESIGDPENWDKLHAPEPNREPGVSRFSIEILRALEWHRFEKLVAAYYAQIGFRAELTRMGADGGVDVVLYKTKEGVESLVAILQCKAWAVNNVGVKPIREIFGVMTDKQAPAAIFITCGEYSQEARDFADNKPITLINGTGLISRLNGLNETSRKALFDEATTGDFTTPTCPRCGIPMTKRLVDTEKEFWGCARYPKCKATLRVRRA